MVKTGLFTKNQLEVIKKKIVNKKLTQIESNYLSRSIRPRLREMTLIDAQDILNKMEYNQRIKSIENKIKKVILKSMSDVQAIIIYGSAIQNNYKDYNDIDIIISTKNKIYATNKERWKDIKLLKNILNNKGIIADIQILSKEALEYNSSRNPGLVYQLKDHKVIYGNLKISKKIEIYNADLLMKLDWSEIYDLMPKGEEVYRALRNTLLVRLILNKIIDNQKLKESLQEEIGKNLVERLKSNKETKSDKKIALIYLKNLLEDTRKQIKGALWEKIEL
jgi:predicted nucleotidyltransferase